MRYCVYKVIFSISINAVQKAALNALNKYLPGQIIVNTSLPLPNRFALGEEIGNELEIESEDKFNINALNIAITMANEDLGSTIIESVIPINTNIVDEAGEGVLTDLVDLSI